MNRSYFWIPTLIGFFLSWWWVDRQHREVPAGIEIKLATIDSPAPIQPFRLKSGDLIWLIDEKGQMMSQEGTILWLDQLDQLLRDEKKFQIRPLSQVVVELWIDQRCPFEALAPILQVGANLGICMQLRLLPAKEKA